MRILALGRCRDSYPSNPNMDSFKISKRKKNAQPTNRQFPYIVYLEDEKILTNYVDKKLF